MTDSQPSTAWSEIVAEDEEAQFEALAHDVNRMQEHFARRSDGRARRGFHTKPHTGLKAEFRVMADIPEYAKHGVFSQPRTFEAWVRISNGFTGVRWDKIPDLRGFAVKLLGVVGPKLMPEQNAETQDFLALNVRYIPARNAREFVQFSVAGSQNFVTAPFKFVRHLGLSHSVRMMLWGLRLIRPVSSLASESYWSNVPITVGPYVIKFRWVPQQASKGGLQLFSSRNHLRQELEQRLMAEEVRFDFMAQFYVDEERTPIEKGAQEWKEVDAPFVKLAELVIPSQDLSTYQAKVDQQYANTLSFDPWHGLVEHRPIGNVQRARAAIYRASSRLRGHVGEPS